MDPEDNPLSPETEPEMTDHCPVYHRRMRSLNMLATKFVELVKGAEGGVLDLKEAVKILAVSQKRRIYDITNVLEGVGLIKKISKSVVKWMGEFPGDKGCEESQRVTDLQSELEDLKEQEVILDQLTHLVKESIRSTVEDCSAHTYVNHEDICNSFSGHTLLAVQAPHGTQLDVPIPKAVQNSPTQYQIYMKSISGPIDVILLNKHSDSSAPVVLPVPPSEEILQRAKSAMDSSAETLTSTAPCEHSVNPNWSIKSERTTQQSLQSLFMQAESNRCDAPGLQGLSKHLRDLLDPTKGLRKAQIFTELMTSEVFPLLLQRSVPPDEPEYPCNLEENDSIQDFYDIPMLNI